MKQIKVLNVYKWATMGGVERVLLNRAHAIKEHGVDNIRMDVYFFHDSGGKSQFIKYIKDHDLMDVIDVVDDIRGHYDYIFSIDTPEILDFASPEKVFIECHTSYERNREYIKSLPNNIRGILVPSNHFYKEVYNELSPSLKTKLSVLTNYIFVKSEKLIDKRIYNKTPLLYVGRLDKLKNIEELIKITSNYNKLNDKLILILVGQIIEHEIDLLDLLTKYEVLNRVVYLPPVQFNQVWSIMRFVSDQGGIFLSASLRETFGLSAAEAMFLGMPVLLLDNEAHKNLVQNDSDFLFSTDNVSETIRKINKILSHYQEYSSLAKNYAEKIDNKFIQQLGELVEIDWKEERT